MPKGVARTGDTEHAPRLRLAACRIFGGRHGELAVSQVKPWHAEQIVAGRRQARKDHEPRKGWGDGSQQIFYISLKAAFNWAVKQEVITRNPLRALAVPNRGTQARDRLLTPAEHELVLNALRKPRQRHLRDLVIALEATGARPGELANARVQDWHDDVGKGAIVYCRDDARREDEFRHRVAGHKDRVIHFPPDVTHLVRKVVAERKPGELIFPTNGG